MATILDTIVKHKLTEIQLKKELLPIKYVEQSPLFNRACFSLSQALKKSESGIIAEHKRRSPSKPNINQNLYVNEVLVSYQKAGACGSSVLTDNSFFGGSLEDLQLARSSVQFPLLRKDFIIDEYQMLEAKANGADVILLIAAILSPQQIKNFALLANELGMEVLLEVHNTEELQANLQAQVQLIGVNNRNLKTFEVSTEISKQLSSLIPEEMVKISESGLQSTSDTLELREYGYRGFLIGETFMKTENPGESAKNFIEEIERKK
ncbi:MULTISPECIES: indole-3-glycerol phosphate synthase TrpC [Mesonia]|uniref:Indole-3-glycerol phosphate synthase n=1 Tax=Mesonia oceanica TaxID=2687242 RepID=A0AC61Y9J4_9FLAO|nr:MULTISPECIES: indole-3-glycerol phosphate synthase TrpC [Mesonia]MAN27902.1 indole-3-glycerol phosphate synthase [Mesonia sp.]MAQ41081.1 indole-3-glycerol phosphate synthase [Mesonia sp.]MBJ96379.1 indole-3-glycerol phosphate synthase [Flavobacteriaceae bacterium]VVV01177.1 Indole-3-glycerol phosphate synthase [Mesonia oceanica]|tara:strand:+ start:3553 stop:4347 length:795 start_codon:yes stop_codon:yes gene_type:complete